MRLRRHVGAAGASRTLRHTRRLRDESATRIIQLKIVPAPEEVEVFQHKRTCKLDITAESVTARADLPPPFIWRLLRRCSATRFAPGMTENISTAFSCQRLRLPLQSRQRAVLDGWDPGGYERASVVTEASRRRILSAFVSDPNTQILSFCPLEVKNLLTADSTWKERTSLQRMQTMEAPKTAGPACPPASPPARNLANTERLFYWTSWVGF